MELGICLRNLSELIYFINTEGIGKREGGMKDISDKIVTL